MKWNKCCAGLCLTVGPTHTFLLWHWSGLGFLDTPRSGNMKFTSFFNVCTMRNDKSWDFAQHSGDETIYQAKIFGLNSLLTFSESISLLQEMTRFYLRALPWPPGHPALWELPGEGATQHPECHHSASAVQDDTPTLGNAALLMNTGCGQCAFLIRTVDVHFGLHSNLSGCLT